MASTNDNIDVLYKALERQGFNDIGTPDEFRQYVSDSKNVETLHKALESQGFNDIGSKDDFQNWLKPVPKNGTDQYPQPTNAVGEVMTDNGEPYSQEVLKLYYSPENKGENYRDLAQIAVSMRKGQQTVQNQPATIDTTGFPQTKVEEEQVFNDEMRRLRANADWRDQTIETGPDKQTTKGEAYDQLYNKFNEAYQEGVIGGKTAYAQANSLADQMGISMEDRQKLLQTINRKYANDRATEAVQAIMDKMPERSADLLQDLQALYYDGELQKQLMTTAAKMGNDYQDYINMFVKPQLVEALKQKYGGTDNDWQGVRGLFSNWQHVGDRLESQNAQSLMSEHFAPAIDQAIDEAEERAVAKEHELMKGNTQQFIPGTTSGYGTIGAAAYATRQGNQLRDPDLIQKEFEENLFKSPTGEGGGEQKDKLLEVATNEIMKDENLKEEIIRRSKEKKISPEQYTEKYVVPQMIQAVRNRFEQTFTQRAMPKSTLEHIMKGLTEDNIMAMIANRYLRTESQQRYANMADAMTEQGKNPNIDPNIWAEGARLATGMAADFWLWGGWGKLGAKATGELLAKRVAERAAAEHITTAAAARLIEEEGKHYLKKGIVDGMMRHIPPSAITLAGAEGTGTLMRGIRDREDAATIIGNTLGSVASGATTGTLFGVTGGAMNRLTSQLTGLKRLGGKLAGFGAEASTMYTAEELKKMAQGEDAFQNPYEGLIESGIKLGFIKASTNPMATGAKLIEAVRHPVRAIKGAMTPDKPTLNEDDVNDIRESAEGAELMDALTRMRPAKSTDKEDREGYINEADAEVAANAYRDFMTNPERPWERKQRVARLLGGVIAPPGYEVETEIASTDNGTYLRTKDIDSNVIREIKYNSRDEADEADEEMMNDLFNNKTEALKDKVNNVEAYARFKDYFEQAYQQVAEKMQNGKELTKADKQVVYLHQHIDELTDIYKNLQAGEELSEKNLDGEGNVDLVDLYVEHFNAYVKQGKAAAAYEKDYETANGLPSGFIRNAIEGHTESEARKLAEQTGEGIYSFRVGDKTFWRTNREQKAINDYQQSMIRDIKEFERLQKEKYQEPEKFVSEDILLPDNSQRPPQSEGGTKGFTTPPPSEGGGSEGIAGPTDTTAGGESGGGAPTDTSGTGGGTPPEKAERRDAAYTRGLSVVDDTSSLPGIGYDNRLATARMMSQLPDGDRRLADIRNRIMQAVMDDDDAETDRIIGESNLTATQLEAIEQWRDAIETQRGVDEAVIMQVEDYETQLRKSLQAVANAQGDVIPLTLNNGETVYHLSGDLDNHYGGIIVADENGERRQIPVRMVKELQPRRNIEEILQQTVDARIKELRRQYQGMTDGSVLQAGQQVDMIVAGQPLTATVGGFDANGNVILTLGDGSTMPMGPMDAQQAITEAADTKIQQQLSMEAESTRLAEQQRRFSDSITGYQEGQPDLTARDTRPEVAAEYIKSLLGTDGTDPEKGRKQQLDNIQNTKEQLRQQHAEAEKELKNVESWLAGNEDIATPEEVEDAKKKTEDLEAEIKDITMRQRKWGDIRRSLMNKEELAKLEQQRRSDIFKARSGYQPQQPQRNLTSNDDRITLEDGKPNFGLTSVGNANNYLLRSFEDSMDAEKFVTEQRIALRNRQRDKVQPQINSRLQTLNDYTTGHLELTPDELGQLTHEVADLEALQDTLSQEAIRLREIADGIPALYERNGRDRQLTPAEQRWKDLERASSREDKLRIARNVYQQYPEALDIINDQEPRDISEYIAQNLGPKSINWEGRDIGGRHVRGLQEELGSGWQRGIGKGYSTNAFNMYLAPEGEGKGVEEIVHGMYEAQPDLGDGKMYSTEDLRNGLIDLLSTAQRPSDISHRVIESRISEAEAIVQRHEEYEREMEEQAKMQEMREWAASYHLTPEEREDFEELMKIPPTEIEQEIINKIIAENEEQNKGSQGLDQEHTSGTAGRDSERGKTEVQGQGAAGTAGTDTEQHSIEGAEADTGVPPVSGTDVPGGTPGVDSKGYQGLEGYTEEDITDLVRQHFANLIGSDSSIVGVKVIGSRANGTAKEDSDLDVLLEYEGSMSEDGLFNILNNEEDKLYIEGIPVDINPITKGKSGTIEQWLERNKDYQKDQSFPARLAKAKEETDTNPTEAQKKAGNYKMGHISFGGYNMSIENPKGSTRSGVDQNGRPWSIQMMDSYGYIGKKYGADGDHLDFFINDEADLDSFNGRVYIVDQKNEDGTFDEHKVMYGYLNWSAARKAYERNYEPGWWDKHVIQMVGVKKSDFDKWLADSDHKTKPFGDYYRTKMLADAVSDPVTQVMADVRDRMEEERKKTTIPSWSDEEIANMDGWRLEQLRKKTRKDLATSRVLLASTEGLGNKKKRQILADNIAKAETDLTVLDAEIARRREQAKLDAENYETGSAMVDHLQEMGVDVIDDPTRNRRALKRAEKDNSETGKLRKMSTDNGTVYGFTYNGKMYLDPRKINGNLPLHEYGHLWCEAFRRLNPEGWQEVKGLMKQDADTWQFIKALYPELTSEDDIAEEMIARGSGDRGEERIRQEYERMSQLDPSYKSKWNNIWKNISKAIQDFWKKIGDFLHIKYENTAQVYDQVLKDFAEGVNPRKKVEEWLKQRDDEYLQAVEDGDMNKATRLFNDALKENIGNGMTPFVAVDKYRPLRSLAHKIKDGKEADITKAAKMMAPLIPENAVLIPAPSHTGKATDMLELAKAIAQQTGSEVADILSSAPRASQYDTKKQGGKPIKSKDMGITVSGEIPEGKIPVVIDNVVDSGNTAEACIQALGNGIVASLADSTEKGHAATLRSAAPVIYDKEGNVMPLSQRFKLGKPMFYKPDEYVMLPATSDQLMNMIEESDKASLKLKNVYEQNREKLFQLIHGDDADSNPYRDVVSLVSAGFGAYVGWVREAAFELLGYPRFAIDEVAFDQMMDNPWDEIYHVLNWAIENRGLDPKWLNKVSNNDFSKGPDKYGLYPDVMDDDSWHEYTSRIMNNEQKLFTREELRELASLLPEEMKMPLFNALVNMSRINEVNNTVVAMSIMNYGKNLTKFINDVQKQLHAIKDKGIVPTKEQQHEAILKALAQNRQINDYTSPELTKAFQAKIRDLDNGNATPNETIESVRKLTESLPDNTAKALLKIGLRRYDLANKRISEGKEGWRDQTDNTVKAVRQALSAMQQSSDMTGKIMSEVRDRKALQAAIEDYEHKRLTDTEKETHTRATTAVLAALDKAKVPVRQVSQKEADQMMHIYTIANERAIAEYVRDMQPDQMKRYAVIDVRNPYGIPKYFEKLKYAKKYMDWGNRSKGLHQLFDLEKFDVKNDAQREAAEITAMMGGNKKAPEPAVPGEESPFKATAISDANRAKVQNNLEILAKKSENLLPSQKKDFLKNLSMALGAEHKGSGSRYVDIDAKNGTQVTLRLADHNATVSGFDQNKKKNGVSIVISRHPNEGVKDDSNAHIIEYFYPDKELRNADGTPYADIVRSVVQMLYSGEYKDTTGLAKPEEVNVNNDFLMPQIEVWHGSGAVFTKFDHSHMGEGAGSQSFGYGTYLTTSERIGRSYGLIDRGDRWAYKGKKRDEFDRNDVQSEPIRNILLNLAVGDHFKIAVGRERNFIQSAIRDYEENFDDLSKLDLEDLAIYKQQLELVNSLKFEDFNEPKSQLYKVDIPDDTGENYLDWENELPEQRLKDLQNHVYEEMSSGFNSQAKTKLKAEIEGHVKGDGQTIYMSLVMMFSKWLGYNRTMSDAGKYVSELLGKFGYTGIKYPAGTIMGGGYGATNYVVFNENNARIVDHIQFMSDNRGTGKVYGWTDGSGIYLTPLGMNPNSPIHEYTHIWDQYIQKENPKLWKEMVDTFKKTQMWQQVRENPNYRSIWDDDDRMASEVHSRLSGAMSEEEFMAAAAADKAADSESLINKVKDVLRRFWEAIARMFGKKVDRLDEFVRMPLRDLLEKRFNPMREKSDIMQQRDEIIERTMMGVHNISEDKLRKVLKQGGLANPSLAVIDTETGYIHTDYGDISLIPKSSLIDARTGRNAGTYTGDAWTPTYPKVERFLTRKGDKHRQQIAKQIADGDPETERHLLGVINDWVEGNGDRMHWLFLKQKGLDPEVKPERTTHSHEEFEEIQKIFGEGTSTLPSQGRTKEQDKALLDLMTRNYEDQVRQQAQMIKDEDKRETAIKARLQTKLDNLVDKDGNLYFAPADSYIYENWRDERKRKNPKPDWYATDNEASYRVAKEDLAEEYEKWKQNLLNDEDIEEKLFAGWTSDGDKRYVPNTVQNASRLMNREADTNSYGNGGLNASKAGLLKKLKSLSEIRKYRHLLKNGDEIKDRHKEMEDEWFDIIQQVSNMQQVDSNRFINIDIAEARLQEAMQQRDPISYMNKEYGYDIARDSELASQWMNFIDEAKQIPVRYFETKFKRPVGLNEFAIAVVPDTTSPDIVQALKDAGLDVRTYVRGGKDFEADKEERRKAVMDAVSQRTDILFQIENPEAKILQMNAKTVKMAEKQIEELYTEGLKPNDSINMRERVLNMSPKELVEQYKRLDGEMIEDGLNIDEREELFRQNYINKHGIDRNFGRAIADHFQKDVEKYTYNKIALRWDVLDRIKELGLEAYIDKDLEPYVDMKGLEDKTTAKFVRMYRHTTPAIRKVNAKFNKELDKLSDKSVLHLGMPSVNMLASGIENKPMKMYGSKLLGKIRKHGYEVKDVRNLPVAMHNPIAIFKGSQDKSFAILTELRIKGIDVLVSLSSGSGNDVDFNIISSTYPKDAYKVVNWINTNRGLYYDKEKALDFLHHSAPIAETTESTASSAAKVVKDFQNPKLSEENLRNIYAKEVRAAEETADLLGGVKVTFDAEAKEDGALGWYDPNDNSIHVVVAAHDSPEEVRRTVCHEKLGHEGLVALTGSQEETNKLGDFIFKSSSKTIRQRIIQKADDEGYGWDDRQRFSKAAQEVLADIAADGPRTQEEFSLWQKVKHYIIRLCNRLHLRIRGLLNDHDLAYYILKTGEALKRWNQLTPMEQKDASRQYSIMYSRKGKPRKRNNESMAQYLQRLREWEKWKIAEQQARENDDPMPDLEQINEKWHEQFNRDMDAWRQDNHIAEGKQGLGEFPKREKGESPQAYAKRVADYETEADAWGSAPRLFDYLERANDEYREAYRAWKERYGLQEQENVDMALYEDDPDKMPHIVDPEDLEADNRAEADLAEAVGVDMTSEGARRHTKLAVIERRKNLESANAVDAVWLHNLTRRINQIGKEAGVRGKDIRESLIYIIEADRYRHFKHLERQEAIDKVNGSETFQKNHTFITAENLEQLHEEMKRAGDYYRMWQKEPTDPMAAAGFHHAATDLAEKLNELNKDSQGYYNVYGDEIMKVFPLLLKASAAGGGSAMPTDAERFTGLPGMQELLDDIKDWYDEFYHVLEDVGLRNEAGYIAEGYVNHVWDKQKSDPKAWERYVENWQRTKSPNMHTREIPTYMQGIEVRLVPKYHDIVDIMAYYSASNNEAVANKKFLDDLSFIVVEEKNTDGEVVSVLPLLNSNKPNIAVSDRYDMYKVPGVGDIWVLKDIQRSFSNIFGTIRTKDIPEWLTKAGKVYDITSGLAKKIELSFSAFHMGALAEVAMAQMRPDRALRAIARYIILDCAKSGTIPAYTHPEDFKLAASHLVQLGATQDYAAADVNAVTEKFRKIVHDLTNSEEGRKMLLGKTATPLADMLDYLNKGFDKVLWNYLHDGLKMACFKMFAEQIDRRVEKEGLSAELHERLLDEAGQYVNDTFGGQYWELIEVSPALVKWMRRAFLSPDWLISTQRHFLANFGFGSLYSESGFLNYLRYNADNIRRALGADIPRDELRRFRSKNAKLCYLVGVLGFFYMMMNALNSFNRGRDVEKEKAMADEIRKTNPDYKSPYELKYPDGMKWYDYTMYGNTIGHQTHLFLGRYNDGTEWYARWGKQFREFPELFLGRHGVEFPTPLMERMSGKANPIGRYLLYDLPLTVGMYGYNQPRETREIAEKYGNAIAVIAMTAKKFLPYSVPTQEEKEFKLFDLVMPSQKGFSRWKAVDYFKTYIQAGDMDGVMRTYNAAVMNGIDAESCLKAAISTVKATQRKELHDGIHDLQTAMEHFDAAKTAEERKQVKRRIHQYLAEQDYKTFSQADAREQVEDLLNGEQPTDSEVNNYVKLQTAGDVTADYRLSALKKTAKKYADEVKTAEGERQRKLKDHYGCWLDIYDIIREADRKINKLKRQIGKGDDDADIMEKVRSIRNEAQQKADQVQAP